MPMLHVKPEYRWKSMYWKDGHMVLVCKESGPHGLIIS